MISKVVRDIISMTQQKLKISYFSNILTFNKSYENVLNCKIYTKLWLMLNLIRFDKINGFIRISDGTRYLILLGPEKYDVIFNRSKKQYYLCHCWLFCKDENWFILFFVFKKIYVSQC